MANLPGRARAHRRRARLKALAREDPAPSVGTGTRRLLHRPRDGRRPCVFVVGAYSRLLQHPIRNVRVAGVFAEEWRSALGELVGGDAEDDGDVGAAGGAAPTRARSGLGLPPICARAARRGMMVARGASRRTARRWGRRGWGPLRKHGQALGISHGADCAHVGAGPECAGEVPGPRGARTLRAARRTGSREFQLVYHSAADGRRAQQIYTEPQACCARTQSPTAHKHPRRGASA
jgi:hypothetical protein